MLTDAELERYARHIVLPEMGGHGQQKLASAKVLVIGAGGLGAPALAYLAAAGVGTLGIADDDVVALSNLQRQIIHTTDAVGERKTASAAGSLERLNPHVTVQQWPVRLNAGNAYALVSMYDLVIDGSDNYATRALVARVAEELEVTLVSAAVSRFDGSLTVLKPWQSDSDGHALPSYRDIFPEPPPQELVPDCAEAGILGALTGVIGSLQAMEAIKEITGIGESLAGRLLLYDALSARFQTIRSRGK